MRESVAAGDRPAMMGKALSGPAGVSDVTGMGDMSATSCVDAARVDATPMRAAGMTHMHAATVVSRVTAKMPTAAVPAATMSTATAAASFR